MARLKSCPNKKQSFSAAFFSRPCGTSTGDDGYPGLRPGLLSGRPFPGFPVELGGFGKLHAPFLTERRKRGLVQRCVAGNPGSGLDFPLRAVAPSISSIKQT
jgi:hypothetical protein